MPGSTRGTIETHLAAHGFPPRDELDDESANLVGQYEDLAPVIAAFASRGWVFACGIEELVFESTELLAALVARARLDMKMECLESGEVQVTDQGAPLRRFDVRGSDDAEIEAPALSLAAHLLEEHGFSLLWTSDSDTVLLAVVPRAVWEPLSPDVRGDLTRVPPAARPWNEPDKVWN
jgi:hypothetical protein